MESNQATDNTAQVQGAAGHEETVVPLGHVDQYLQIGQQGDASDLHLAVNCKPTWRHYGQLQPIWPGATLLTAEDTERLAMGFLNEAQQKRLEDQGDVDFAYSTPFGRFRASVVRHRLGVDMVFRIINTKLRTMEDLGLPKVLQVLTEYHNGLILVTGSVGCGKSTTLAAMVNYINENRGDHIITLEDPIEYVIPSKGCQVTQREVRTHTKGFSNALRGALREDPDVIMVGEMRDLETIQLAITASETGHLVLGTLNTSSAPRTLDRILDVFPAEQRDQIRIMVAESIRGIVSQQLIPRADGTGRVLALEILRHNNAVAACIRDGKTFMLPGIMQTGKNLDMKLMDDSLLDLLKEGLITEEECIQRADQKAVVRAAIAELR
jgi:twitching motility protein PilT